MQNRIMTEYKNALLNKNDDKKRVINTLRAEIKNKEIEFRPLNKEVTDSDILSIIQKLIKQNKDASDMFKTGGRLDLVEKNNIEISILEEFLPKQLTNEEVIIILKDIISTENILTMKDIGKVMQILKDKYLGQIDMSTISKFLKELLVA